MAPQRQHNHSNVIGAVTISLLLFLAHSSRGQHPTITLESGIYEGIATQLPGSSNTIHKYLGVPFAAPPLGQLRFAPPKALSPSTEQKFAKSLPSTCLQNGGNTRISESEDCLYLNVFAPMVTSKSSSNAGKTVMLWLFGGGLQSGSASLPLYDGSSFAASQDVILVAPNYRTNVFGFPGVHPSIAVKERNLGLLDQRFALSWVQQNIAKFGGDPYKVTLFGQSAGARSADFHLLTMANNPPFRAVIMQSGSSELTPLADAKRAEKSAAKGPAFQQLATALGCNDPTVIMECMRIASAPSIKQTVKNMSLYFGSTYDGGYTTVRDQAIVRKAHQAANVPLLIGTNADEERSSVRSWQGKSREDYLDTTFGNRTSLKDRLIKAYRTGQDASYQTEFDAIAAIATDMSFTCITAREARISTESGSPTWRYLFGASFPNIEKFPGSGSYHAAEIQFVFGNLPESSTAEEIELSKLMQETWARFAKDPTVGPRWDPKSLAHFGIDGKLDIQSSAVLDRNCANFEELYEGRA